MAKTVRSMRLSDRTWGQLDELARRMGLDDRTRAVEVLAEQAVIRLEIPRWKLSLYHDNPRHNKSTYFETREEAEAEASRYEVTSYIENIQTGEWAKFQPGTDAAPEWFPATS